MNGLAAVAGVALAAVAVVALRRPTLRRLALRSAVRRKGETVLVIIGSLLGTAIVTGSLLVGDTLDASIRASAPEQLGPTDLVVRTGTPEAAARVARALDGYTSDDVDGALVLRVGAGALSAGSGDDRAAVPRAQLLEVDFAAAADFGGDPSATGVAGDAPSAGEVVVVDDLADDLGVRAGDEVDVLASGTQRTLRIARVVPTLGVAGLQLNHNDSGSPNALVAEGFLGELTTGAGAQPPQDLVLVSATGDVFGGADRSAAATRDVRAQVEGIRGVEVEPVKRDLLDAAKVSGDSFSELFLSIGSFAVLAGVLLLVNIFVMLAEERKPELGMLRAVGMRRSDLVGSFVVEGAAYALVAAALGAAVGIGVGRVIVLVTAGIFSSFDDNLTLEFAPQASSVATGFLVGLLIGLATVVGTSLRISRLNIIRAIRDLPEPAVTGGRRFVLLAAVAATAGFAALAVVAVNDGTDLGAVLFPALAVTCAAVSVLVWLSRRRDARVGPRRAVVSASALAVLVWATVAFTVLRIDGGDISLFVVQGVLLTFSATALVSQNQEMIGGLVRRLGGGSSLVARLGLAYPLARRFRTGMTLLMYSLVVFTLVFLSVLSNLFAGQGEQLTRDEGGGFEVLASASPAAPADPGELAEVDGVARVATLTFGLGAWRIDPADQPQNWPVSGFDDVLVDTGPPALAKYDRAEYTDELQVWRAVAEDPSLAIADAVFLQTSSGPPQDLVEVGQTVQVTDRATGRVSERTIAAISDAGTAFSGVFMSTESARAALAQASPSRYYVEVASGADPDEVARRLQGGFLANGLEASSFRAIIDETLAVQDQFLTLMQGFLALGLVVGIAGLGVVMVRAVRERRREVGMLRSLGLQTRTVRNAFLLESGFIALEGILVGAGLALVTSYQLVANSDVFGDFGIGFSVPWPQLAVLLGVALSASLLATLAPATRAARIRPAVALRID